MSMGCFGAIFGVLRGNTDSTKTHQCLQQLSVTMDSIVYTPLWNCHSL